MHRSQCGILTHFAGTVFVMFIYSATQVSFALSPQQIVEAYARSLEPYDRAVFTAESKTFCTSPLLKGESLVTESNVRCWRNGDKWRLLRSSRSTLPYRGKREETREANEIIFVDKGMTYVTTDPQTNKVVSILAYLDELPPRLKRAHYGVSHAPIYGYLPGNSSILLPQILKDHELRHRQESREGVPFEILEANGRWGSIELWLDRKNGYLPRHIRQSKEGADWFDQDKPMYTYPRERDEGAIRPKGAAVRRLVTRFDATKIEWLADVPLITAFVLTQEEHFDNAHVVVLRTEVRLSGIQLDPNLNDEAFRVGTPVANGTPVQVADREGIVHEWRDGKIIKSVRQDSVDSLSGNWFQRGSWLGRGAIIFSILAVLGFGAAVYLYRKRMRQT